MHFVNGSHFNNSFHQSRADWHWAPRKGFSMHSSHSPRASQPGSLPGQLVAVSLWLVLTIEGAEVLLRGAPAGLPPLSLAIGALTLFVAAVVATFSLRYMRADPHQGRYYARLGLLAASVLAFVTSQNLIVLGIAWLASGVLLAALIGHRSGWAEAQASARRTRRAFLIGDGALVFGLGLLGWQAGSADIATVLAAAPAMPASVAVPAALLLLVAAAARCALPPFSGWLLSSMTAPTPVSALMHAGLVNAGGFLLIRFAPLFEAAPAARLAALVVGLIAAVHGVGIMMVRPDVKRALAGSTVSQMGFMIMSCGLGAYAAALWHIVAHGLFKAWLFLGSGSAVGMKPRAEGRETAGFAIPAAALVTLVLAGLLVATGKGDVTLVPLLLGIATAVATLAGSIGGNGPARARLSLAGGVVALVALHAAGLALIHRAVSPDAPALVPGWALVGLLAAFLGAWLWQQQRLAARRPLPPQLYVHLINAGAHRATN
jgi:NADH:ubiquinone oxidoreductase subunit 5 (subunit L)/multisubunit Na+/H+ antiporter MnhA subunit